MSAHPSAGPARALAALGVIAILAVCAGLQPRTVEAHSVLVRSSPAAGAQLGTAPAVIELWFSEPLEPQFSSFELLASDGGQLQVDGIEVDAADELHLTGLPRRLSSGLYTVAYRTLSKADGHEWSGSFSFTVLNPDGSVPAGEAYAAAVGGGSSPANITGRWLTFLGAAIVIGGAQLVLLDRRSRGGLEDSLGLDAARLYRRLTVAALPLLAGGAALQLMSQLEALDTGALEVLSGSRFGTLWLWRALAGSAVATTLALVFLAARRERARERRWLERVLPLFALGELLTVSMLSHAAAAPGRAWAVAFDYVHLALAAAWVGGIVAMAALLLGGRGRWPAARRGDAVLRWVAPFSSFAAVSVYVLGVTGLIRAFGELPTVEDLFGTEYGRWLLVKIGLLTPMLGVALVNRRALRGASSGAAASRDAARRLGRLLPLEAALGAAVLASVAVLGQVPTPRGQAAPPVAAVTGDYNRIVVAGDLTVHLQVMPAQVGDNRLRVHVYRPDGSSIGQVERVRITFATSAAGGGEQVDAAPSGGGIFEASGSFLSLARTWLVRIEVQRAGLDDVRADYDVPIAAGAGSSSARDPFGSPAPQLTPNTLWALLAMAAGVGIVLRWRSAPRRGALRAGGAALIVAALWLAVSGERHVAEVSGGLPENPALANPASIARGEALFRQHCVTCHGESGQGNGPAAASLSPPPADLSVHVPFHPDGQTFIFIKEGFPGTAMPAWKDRLSDDQIWDLVNFLRALTDQQTR